MRIKIQRNINNIPYELNIENVAFRVVRAHRERTSVFSVLYFAFDVSVLHLHVSAVQTEISYRNVHPRGIIFVPGSVSRPPQTKRTKKNIGNVSDVYILLGPFAPSSQRHCKSITNGTEI